MKFLVPLGFALMTLVPVSAALVGKSIDYSDDHGTPLEGYVVYDDEISGPRPGVIVIHDWRGITEETKRRADMLAKLGYIAFAADIYGKSVRPQSVPEYGKQAG